MFIILLLYYCFFFKYQKYIIYPFNILNYFSQDYFGKVKNGHFKNVQNQEIPNSLEKLNDVRP